MKRLLLIAMLLSMSTAAVRADKASQWVDSVYNTLSLRERVAQLFIPHLVINDNDAGRAAIRRYVGKDKVGGILLGAGTVASYAALNDYAMSKADIPLMITADAEWGLSMRLKDAPRFPRNLALGAGENEKVMERYGREMARQCRLLGISVSFAPVVDVNTNPLNPVIGDRSFGEDPRRVSRLAKAYARGLEYGGVMAVAKHFPGHGDTSSDSHLALPKVTRSLAELEAADLVPFADLIKDGIGGVMVGHLDVPSIDKTGTPASLSEPIVTELLKRKMGFDGLVFTDALEMKGAKSRDGSNNCVAALAAGADVLLGSLSPSTDIDAVVAAVSSGRISERRVEESVRKVLTHKYYLGLSRRPSIPAHPKLSDEQTGQVLDDLARMSVTLLRDDDAVLPLKPSVRIAVVPIGGGADAFTGRLRHSLGGGVDVCDGNTKFDSYDVVIAPVVSSKENAVKALSVLKTRAGRRLVPVFFTNTYRTGRFSKCLSGLSTVVIAGDNTAELQRAVADGLTGKFLISGRLPVSVDGVGNLGDGIDGRTVSHGAIDPGETKRVEFMIATIDSLIDTGLERGAFPGCQVIVVRDGAEVYSRSAGYTDSRHKAKVTSSTLFDIASVSKLAGTLIGVMAADDMMPLDSHLGDYFDAGPEKGALTLRQLITHRSGLPASINAYSFAMDTATYDGRLFRAKADDTYSIRVERNLYGNRHARLRNDLYSNCHDKDHTIRIGESVWASPAAHDSIVAHIIDDVPLRGSKAYRYSCLNYILLGRALESSTGHSLDEWLETKVYRPMGLDCIAYNPLSRFDTDEIAATERDNMLRKSLVHGTVHDETAALAGGVAGNAGLFANAGSLAALGEMLLSGGVYHGRRILDADVIARYVDNVMGFDTNGKRWIGHTGFTGTCLWLDPVEKIVVVVLTNRVNPSRENGAFKALNFRNAVLRAVENCYSETGVTP